MPNDHLPAAIEAAATALATELSAWAAAHPDSTLADQEEAVLAAMRRASPALLAGLLQTTQGAQVRVRLPRADGGE